MSTVPVSSLPDGISSALSGGGAILKIGTYVGTRKNTSYATENAIFEVPEDCQHVIIIGGQNLYILDKDSYSYQYKKSGIWISSSEYNVNGKVYFTWNTTTVEITGGLAYYGYQGITSSSENDWTHANAEGTHYTYICLS